MAREIHYKRVSSKTLGMALVEVPYKNLAMTSLDMQKCSCSSFPPGSVPWGEEPLLTPLNFKDPWRHAAHLKFITCKRHSSPRVTMSELNAPDFDKAWTGLLVSSAQAQKWHQVRQHPNFWIWIPVLSFKQSVVPNVSGSVVLLQACFTSHHPFHAKNSQHGATSVFTKSKAIANTLPPCPSTGFASTARSWVTIIPVMRLLHVWHSSPDKLDLALWTPPSPASGNVTFHYVS